MSRTIRQFECRDDLWTRVVALAERRGMTTDEVVEAALVQVFAKRRPTDPPTVLDGPAAAGPRPMAPPPAPAPAGLAPPPVPPRSITPAVPRPPVPAPPRPAGGFGGPGSAPHGSPEAPAPRLPPPSSGGLPRPPAPSGARLPPPMASVGVPRPPAAAPSAAQPLYLLCEGAWYVIDREQFVIGRSAKYSDLGIKDANISRRHCAIVRRGNQYFMKDLGSTNGVEFQGVRVDNHLIQDGTVYTLCDHELRFSFESPF